jgi:uncharacterized membrane protein
MHSDEIPPGWDYNPASWQQRIPIIILAVIGFGISGYLSLYQFRILPTVWDPFFENGSITILNSPISNMFPIPDAALGALGYLADAVGGAVGGRRRWKTMPWIVVFFGVAVGPLGLVSIMLVIFQPVLFNAWCSLCLLTAFISIVMIGPSMDEVLASLQYLRRARASGHSLWRAFWGYREVVKNTK